MGRDIDKHNIYCAARQDLADCVERCKDTNFIDEFTYNFLIAFIDFWYRKGD